MLCPLRRYALWASAHISWPEKFLHMCTTKLVFDGWLFTNCNNERCKATEKWTNQLKGWVNWLPVQCNSIRKNKSIGISIITNVFFFFKVKALQECKKLQRKQAIPASV